MFKLRLILFFAVTVAAAGARAQVSPAGHKLLNRSWETILSSTEKLSTKVKTSPAPNQVLLYFYSGASYTDLLVLCGDPSKAELIAEGIERAASGGALATAVPEYAVEDGKAIVLASDHRGLFPAQKASRSIDIQRYVEELRRLGLSPQVLVRLPLYGTVEAGGYTSENSSVSRYLFTDGTKPVSTITFSAQASRMGVPVLILAVLLPFFSVLIGFVTAITVAKDESIELKERRRKYSKVLNGFLYGGMFVHAPLFLALATTGAYKPYIDLWFGTRLLSGFVPIFFLTPILLMFFVPVAGRLERKLFGARAELGDSRPIPPFRPSIAERKFAVLQGRLFLGLILVASLLMIVVPAGLKLVPLFAVFLINSIVGRFRPGPDAAQFSHKISLAKAEADALASSINVHVKEVLIDRSPVTRLVPSASTTITGRIKISQRMFQVFDDAELKFMLAVCVGRVALNSAGRLALAAWAAPLIALPLFCYSIFAGVHTPVLRLLIFAPLLLMMPFSYYVIRPMARNQTMAADRIALKLTGDLAAARSAVFKLFSATPLPGTAEVADSARPALDERIKGLERAAADLGLRR